MSLVQNCDEFSQQWNEWLDRRQNPAAVQDQALLDHAAGCDSCRARGSIFVDLETLAPLAWSRIPSPSPEAMGRWQAAADAGFKSRRPGSRRRLVRVATRWGATLAAAASFLIVARLSLPFFYAEELGVVTGTKSSALSPMFEEAFSEASTMTWQLAREISAPAARLGNQALGAAPKSTLPPFHPTQYTPVEAPAEISAVVPITAEPREVGLTEAPTQQPFRLLGGRDGEDIQDEEPAEGF